MDKLICCVVIVLLACVVFADSDVTGVLVGSTERLEFGLVNSTGHLDANANCSLHLFDGLNNTLVYSLNLPSYGDGRFYYDWQVPIVVGSYSVYVNCSTKTGENYTRGGMVYVRPRLLEKTVAYGEAKYGDAYLQEYGKPTIAETSPMLNQGMAVFFILLVIVGLVLYEKGVFKIF